MKTLSRSIRKEVTGILFLGVLAVLMLIMTGSAYAATVNGTFKPEDVELGETTYKLYHVADFDEDNKAIFKLLPQYRNVDAGLNFTKEQFGEEGKSDDEAEQWRKAWMDSAETLSNYVKEDDLAGTDTSSDGTFSFTGIEPGLYLLTGSSSPVIKDGRKTYWWPSPMYVRVLAGDNEVTYDPKPTSESALHFTVHKSWDNIPEDMENVKPDEVTVKIFYGGTSDNDLKETVKLNDSNNWMYSWDAGKGETDPAQWFVQEDTTGMEESFYVDMQEKYDEATQSKVFDIKNVYDRKDLEIVKIMKDYISQGNTKQTFVFKVEAYEGEKLAFTRFVGVTFGIGDEEDKALIKNISRNIDRIVVTEDYQGNYKPDQKTKEAKLEDKEDGSGKWTVSFENTLDTDNPPFDTGVINKFSRTGDGPFSFEKSRGSGVN